MKTQCSMCSEEKRNFLFTKPVCIHCDDLLFDIEIEVEEEERRAEETKPSTTLRLNPRRF